MHADHALLGHCEQHMLTPTRSATFQAFSPDGETLISGSDDMQIIFWDWQSSAPRAAVVPRQTN